MQIMKGRKPRSENNEGPNLEERKRIPVWLTEHLLREGEMGEGGVSDAISRWLLLNYKLTHVKQNLSQNNFSKQAFCARVLPFLLKRYIELRRLFKENCEKRLLFLYIYSVITQTKRLAASFL